MQAGPQRPGEESRTILDKNPVKLEENWSGENSCESGEKFRYLILSRSVDPQAVTVPRHPARRNRASTISGVLSGRVMTERAPHTSGPKPVRSNFIRVVQIRVRSSVGGWDAVLFSRCPSHRRTELRTCARVRCKYLSDSWKSTRSLKLQRKFAFGMLFAPFRQLHFKKINCTI